MPTEKIREVTEREISRMCREAGVPERAEQFMQEGRSFVWVRDWLAANTNWSPKPQAIAMKLINVEAIYERFNRPHRS